MSKKTSSIFIIILILILLGGIIFYLLKVKGGNEGLHPSPSIGPVSFTVGGRTIDIPSGGNENINTGGGEKTVSNGNITITGKGNIPKFRRIGDAPGAGTSIQSTEKDRKQSVVRFVDRITGHIYEILEDSWTLVRLSNKTIPKIKTALWNKSGNAVYFRYLRDDTEEIETYYAKLVPIKKKALVASSTEESIQAESEFELQGNFLPRNIEDLVLNPLGDKLAFLLKEGSEASLKIADQSGKVKNSWPLPISEWHLAWPKEASMILTTKPSANSMGGSYFFNTTTGAFSKILGRLGLTTLPNAGGEKLLYGESIGESYSLSLFTIKSEESSSFKIKTFPEKCVWSTKDASVIYCAVPKNLPSSLYPDAWYQGLVSFSDDIYRIDTDTGITDLILDPVKEAKLSMDGIKLTLSPNEDYLIFTDKNDSGLWSLRLTEPPSPSPSTLE